MIKQLIKKIKTPPQPINLGKGTYVQTALHLNNIDLLLAKKTFKITGWAMYKFYKTT